MNDFVITPYRRYESGIHQISTIDFDQTLLGFKKAKKNKISGFRALNAIRVSNLVVEDSNVIFQKECTLDEAKITIAHYFKENDGREISYSELLNKLNLDLNIIINACAELESEGKIG